ncbi:MAG: hypothetical protein GC190_14895 [Alphaproteobacteria bacterium]|nr:hypothetical protein [Alphaproteobacteria bacterium]
MNLNVWIRQLHRWLSVAFALAVIVNIAAVTQERKTLWIGLLALIPLVLLMLTGLYLFAWPYITASRKG